MEFNPFFETRLEVAGDGLFELVIPRPPSRQYRAVFHTYPHLTEYHTGDQFRPHSSNPGLSRYEGRCDDIIFLKNGEKLNPIDAEKSFELDPLVDRAIILGQDRFQVVVLIEPLWNELPSDWTPAWFRENLKPRVDRANSLLPAHSQVFYSHVIFASRDMPLARAPKGSLRRREIASTQGSLNLNRVETEQWFHDVVGRILGQDKVGLDTDVVALGMDSLQAIRLSRALQDATEKNGVTGGPPWIPATIYEMATARRMTHGKDWIPELRVAC
ncbi:uncharacterized protein KD926_007330 [Aspergillus affinis]|uniref:uncharacterized protein n=1 Tax=Aspergillus affinis TaxID=1070780 RepID=UPI0022FE1944|nr:uncharacterized protein KD926_007330 [Aspergillus affinis]KAI9041061.1 hypothetical protein KD926_007330 [Aspergillus affinis]